MITKHATEIHIWITPGILNALLVSKEGTIFIDWLRSQFPGTGRRWVQHTTEYFAGLRDAIGLEPSVTIGDTIDRYMTHRGHSIAATPLFSFVEQAVTLCLDNRQLTPEKLHLRTPHS